jgi:hypothetical protein
MSSCCGKDVNGPPTAGPHRVRHFPKITGLVRSLLKAILLIVAPFWALSVTSAATISSGVDEHGNHYLTLDGPIMAGDPEQLAAAIFEANARGYRLDALRLNSPGGRIWESLAITVMVRWIENVATVIRKDAKCESACFALFAAGQRKYVDPAGNPTQVGVHSVYEIIEQRGGVPALFWREREDTTIWAVRRLKWEVDAYQFVKDWDGETLKISRSSGVFTQQNIRNKNMLRTGSCHRAAPEKKSLLRGTNAATQRRRPGQRRSDITS